MLIFSLRSVLNGVFLVACSVFLHSKWCYMCHHQSFGEYYYSTAVILELDQVLLLIFVKYN